MPKTPKRLTLRLPPDHPIFNYPDGTRAQIARDWLDIGRKLNSIERLLKSADNTLPDPEPTAINPIGNFSQHKVINAEKLRKRIDEML